MNALNGKKTYIGLALTALVSILTEVSNVVTTGVVDATVVSRVVPQLFVLVGAVHKLVKGE